MSIFSFLGGFAVFSCLCDLFSGKDKQYDNNVRPPYNTPEDYYDDNYADEDEFLDDFLDDNADEDDW